MRSVQGAGLILTLLGASGPGGRLVEAWDGAGPSVSATDPVDLAMDVPFDALIAFEFDVDMDPHTVLGSEFELIAPDGGVVNGAFSFDEPSRTATFLANAPLFSGSTYVGRVLTGVSAAAGNAMPAEYTWSFTTASSGWARDRLGFATRDSVGLGGASSPASAHSSVAGRILSGGGAVALLARPLLLP